MNTAGPTLDRARTSSGRGFSLVELIAVILLVGLLAAVSVPAMTKAAESRAEAGIAQLERDLAGARHLACHSGVRVWTVFSLSGQRYELLAEQPGNPGRVHRSPRTDPATGRPFSQPIGGPDWSGVTLVGVNFDSGAEVAFDWRGRPLAASEQPLSANGQLVFSNGRRVVVDRTTGLASRQ